MILIPQEYSAGEVQQPNNLAAAKAASCAHRMAFSLSSSLLSLDRVAFPAQKRRNAKKCEKMRRFSMVTSRQLYRKHLQNIILQQFFHSQTPASAMGDEIQP
jgi:hypothetical protein